MTPLGAAGRGRRPDWTRWFAGFYPGSWAEDPDGG